MIGHFHSSHYSIFLAEGATNDSCSNLYAGPAPFSEPEARAIRDYVLNLKEQGEMIYYIAFHSYTQLIIVPYSHVDSEDSLLSINYADMVRQLYFISIVLNVMPHKLQYSQ